MRRGYQGNRQDKGKRLSGGEVRHDTQPFHPSTWPKKFLWHEGRFRTFNLQSVMAQKLKDPSTPNVTPEAFSPASPGGVYTLMKRCLVDSREMLNVIQNAKIPEERRAEMKRSGKKLFDQLQKEWPEAGQTAQQVMTLQKEFVDFFDGPFMEAVNSYESVTVDVGGRSASGPGALSNKIEGKLLPPGIMLMAGTIRFSHYFQTESLRTAGSVAEIPDRLPVEEGKYANFWPDRNDQAIMRQRTAAVFDGLSATLSKCCRDIFRERSARSEKHTQFNNPVPALFWFRCYWDKPGDRLKEGYDFIAPVISGGPDNQQLLAETIKWMTPVGETQFLMPPLRESPATPLHFTHLMSRSTGPTSGSPSPVRSKETDYHIVRARDAEFKGFGFIQDVLNDIPEESRKSMRAILLVGVGSVPICATCSLAYSEFIKRNPDISVVMFNDAKILHKSEVADWDPVTELIHRNGKDAVTDNNDGTVKLSANWYTIVMQNRWDHRIRIELATLLRDKTKSKATPDEITVLAQMPPGKSLNNTPIRRLASDQEFVYLQLSDKEFVRATPHELSIQPQQTTITSDWKTRGQRR
jgi:hypothetical protein